MRRRSLKINYSKSLITASRGKLMNLKSSPSIIVTMQDGIANEEANNSNSLLSTRGRRSLQIVNCQG
jgi:hypothetical protein